MKSGVQSSGAGFQPVSVPAGVSPAVNGVCLFKLGRLRIELWRVPHGERIPPHVHYHVTSRFVFLDRNLCVYRTGSSKTRVLPWLRWYHVPAGMMHCATAEHGPARFLNVEWWTERGIHSAPHAPERGIHSAPRQERGAPQSAAEDFHPL